MTLGLQHRAGLRRVTLVLVVLGLVTLAAQRVGQIEGDERRAVFAVRAIIQAELNYAADHDGYYAAIECAVEVECNPGARGTAFEMPVLTPTREARGYRFELHAGPRVVDEEGPLDTRPGAAQGRRRRSWSPFAIVAVPVRGENPPYAFCGHLGSSDVYVTRGTVPRVHAGRCLDTANAIPMSGSPRKWWFQ